MKLNTKVQLKGPAKIALVLFIVILLSVITYGYWDIHRILLQAYAWIALLLAFRYWPPMIALVQAMPRPHRAVFLGLIFAIILGHFTVNNRRYFPFISWAIFPLAEDVKKRDPVTCLALIGTTQNGRSVRLLAEQLSPSIVQFNIPNDCDDPATPLKQAQVAQALGALYNSLHPNNPVVSIDLVQLSVSLRQPAYQHNFNPCELLKTYSISSSALGN